MCCLNWLRRSIRTSVCVVTGKNKLAARRVRSKTQIELAKVKEQIGGLRQRRDQLKQRRDLLVQQLSCANKSVHDFLYMLTCIFYGEKR